MNSITFIKEMVVPGVMLSVCGLLLLGMNNKYSLVVNRIRLLNSEYRNSSDKIRKECIKKQIPLLQKRMRLIMSSVWLYTIAVVSFVLVIMLIGISSFFSVNLFLLILATFSVGTVFILIGAILAAQETRLGYRIIRDNEIFFHYKKEN